MGDVESDDPLQLKDLAVKFEYLMFKVKDHMSGLADATEEAVKLKASRVEEEYLRDQLDLGRHMADADRLLGLCRDLDSHFMKLKELYNFAEDFKTRTAALEERFA